MQEIGFFEIPGIPTSPIIERKGLKTPPFSPSYSLSELRPDRLDIDDAVVSSKPREADKLGCVCRSGNFSRRSQDCRSRFRGRRANSAPLPRA